MRLPKDATKLNCQSYRKTCTLGFKFRKKDCRMILPKRVREDTKLYGVDMFVSPSEKCLYLQFVDKSKGQFSFSPRNGYIRCKEFYEWAANAEIPIHDDYLYTDYEIDDKNKLVRVNLVRK